MRWPEIIAKAESTYETVINLGGSETDARNAYQGTLRTLVAEAKERGKVSFLDFRAVYTKYDSSARHDAQRRSAARWAYDTET